MERLKKRMKTNSVNQVVDKGIIDIQALADSLDSTNTDSWLRSYGIWNPKPVP